MFGKNLPIDGTEHNEKRLNETINEQNRHAIRQSIHEKVTRNLRSAYEVNCRRYNTRSGGQNIQFGVGEKIFRRNNKLSDATNKYSAKVAPKFVKCEVKERTGTNTYKVQDVNSDRVGIYHTTQLRR